MFFITEMLGHRQTGKSYSHTSSRTFIHLSINQNRFIQNTAVLHFMIHIISFTCTFTNTDNNGFPTMLCGNIVYQLLDQYGLSDTGTAK